MTLRRIWRGVLFVSPKSSRTAKRSTRDRHRARRRGARRRAAASGRPCRSWNARARARLPHPVLRGCSLEPFDPPTINLRQLRVQHNAKVGSLNGRTIHDNSFPLRLEFQFLNAPFIAGFHKARLRSPGESRRPFDRSRRPYARVAKPTRGEPRAPFASVP